MDGKTRNIILVLEYDGTNYEGWQSQRKKHAATIQETVEEKLRKMTSAPVSLISSGRTDAGVHALGQVASFRTNSSLSPEIIKKGLNSMLPPDIRAVRSMEASPDFHPRFDATAKTYFYLIALMPDEPVFFRRYAWSIPYKLDLRAMEDAASCLRGKHDFSAFRASGSDVKDSLREIISLELKKMKKMEFATVPFRGDYLKISITANGFLRHMARNIVGTLVEVGRGRMSPSDMKKILESLDRKKAGPSAPAHALFLEKVFYKEPV